MAELDLRKSPWNEGLGIPGEFLNHQLYLLGCMVHASPAFDALNDHALQDLRQQFQEVEIGRVMLSIAVAIRNAMDQNPFRAEYWLKGIDDIVGTLGSPEPRSKHSSLRFREACNKLIHCLSINFHYLSDHPRRGMALEPVIHLYGNKGGEEWKATVDINKFIHVAAQLT